jgi:hypothetical protein
VPELLTVPSLGSFLVNDGPNVTPTKFVSNQNRGNGSGSSPVNAQELQAALNGASPGQVFQAVAQTPGTVMFWDYAGGITFPTGSSGNAITLEARQGDGIVLSRCEDFAGARRPNSGFWTQSGLSQADIAKKIWRSTGTFSGGNQKMHGWWMEFDHPHQLLTAGSMANLRAAYGTGDSPGNYSGPMVHKDADNRVYIRMQRPHPGKYSFGNKWSNHIWPGHPEAVSNGQIAYPINENPNRYQIHMFRETNTRAFNPNGSLSNVTVGNGINTLGFRSIGTGSNVRLKRGVDYCWHSYFPASAPSNWFLDRRRVSWGSVLHISRAEWKFGGWLESGYRANFISAGGGSAGNNLYFKDCTICDYHELATGGGSQGHWRFRNCTIWHILDDGFQVGAALSRVELGYCFLLGSAFGGFGLGGSESPDPNPGGWFIHHNIIDVREERGLEWRAHTPPKFCYAPHSPDQTKPMRVYNNTLFWGCDLEQEQPMGFGHLATGLGAVPNTTAVVHEVFNNICIRQVWGGGKRYDPLTGYSNPGENDDPSDFAFGTDMQAHAAESNELWNYNLYYRDLDGSAAVDPFVRGLIGINRTKFNYASLAAWKASAQFEQSKASGSERAAYSPGIEGNSTDVKPTMPSLDNFPADRLKYRPTAQTQVTTASSGSLSGANWWTTPPSWGVAYFNWNGLAPNAWKGALNPNSSALPVGVQNP